MIFFPTNDGYFATISEFIILRNFFEFWIQLLDLWSVVDSGQVVQDDQRLNHQNCKSIRKKKKSFFFPPHRGLCCGNKEPDDVALGHLMKLIN